MFEKRVQGQLLASAICAVGSCRRPEAFALDGIVRALNAIDPSAEAVAFHQTACTLLRACANPCDAPAALIHLATTLLGSGQAERAVSVIPEAQVLLDSYADPRAEC